MHACGAGLRIGSSWEYIVAEYIYNESGKASERKSALTTLLMSVFTFSIFMRRAKGTMTSSPSMPLSPWRRHRCTAESAMISRHECGHKPVETTNLLLGLGQRLPRVGGIDHALKRRSTAPFALANIRVPLEIVYHESGSGNECEFSLASCFGTDPGRTACSQSLAGGPRERWCGGSCRRP
jgi:hypothetical protein